MSESSTKRKQCAACNEAKVPSEFSKSQRSKGDNARCMACVKANTTATAKKKAKVAKPPPKPQGPCCKICEQPRKQKDFPKDQLEAEKEEAPTCLECIINGEQRICKDCKNTKSMDDFSSDEWVISPFYLKMKFQTWNQTTQQIKDTAKNWPSTCKDCKTVQQEKAAAAALEKKQRECLLLKEHNVQFYNFDSAPESYSKTSPSDLCGSYDVIFHVGFCMGEEIENRTTKGTAQLVEKGTNEDGTSAIAGKVEFLEDLRLSSPLCFQRDFELSEGEHGMIESDWQCKFNANLTDQEAKDVIQWEGEPAPAYLLCIDKRTALPWMKEERPEDNEEEDQMVKLESLEQAEELARQHEEGNSDKPQPVFFLEPGDLVLKVLWEVGHGGHITTQCILRKQNGSEQQAAMRPLPATNKSSGAVTKQATSTTSNSEDSDDDKPIRFLADRRRN